MVQQEAGVTVATGGMPTRSLWVASTLAIVTTVGAGLVTAWGLSDSSKVWIISGAAIFAIVAVSATRRVVASVESRRAGGLVTFAGLAIIYIIAIILVGPSGATEYPSHELYLVAPDQAALVYLRSEPGGSELTGKHAPEPLRGARPYRFACRTSADDGNEWAELSSGTYWAPVSALRTESGRSASVLPEC